MFSIERHEKIINIVNKRGSVTVSELSEYFHVSIETIRKDLILLEKKNMLARTHGGAISKKKKIMASPLKERLLEYTEEKKELCKNALKYINNGDIIAIDEGSTSIELARLIVNNFSDLTVITNDLNIFNVLCNSKEIKTILCGGDYFREENTFTGYLTVETIKKLHTDKFFLTPSAVSLKHGITAINPKLFEVQAAFADNTSKIIVLADNNKFEQTAFFKVTETNKDIIIITDSKLDDEIYSKYIEQGIKVER